MKTFLRSYADNALLLDVRNYSLSKIRSESSILSDYIARNTARIILENLIKIEE